MFEAHLAGRVVEVGAGRGTFSAKLSAIDAIDELILVEPDLGMHGDLGVRFADNPRVSTHHGYFGDHDLGGEVDAIVLVNVLEHIEDDADLVASALAALRPGGALLLFVPAGPWLYGSLDEEFEHFRRYTRSQLNELLTSGGLSPEDVYYVNAPGMLAWFVAGRLLRQRTVRTGQMKLYDRLVIPFVSRLEAILRPPRGQSLTAIAIRPPANAVPGSEENS
ncbi:MAG: methyltransferase domain-containing protein [Acidobacteria bacterium]|nr:methyltransferase domain-containing protein [Acidobacteriota bacterium]